MKRAEPPEIIPLWPHGVPKSEGWMQREQETFAPPPFRFRTIRNVTQPTLTVFLPHPSAAIGTAVVICPGGGFHSLAVDHEGIEVAHWLNERGVAAFVLKLHNLKEVRAIAQSAPTQVFMPQVAQHAAWEVATHLFKQLVTSPNSGR